MRLLLFFSLVVCIQNCFSNSDEELENFKKRRDEVYGEVIFSSVVFRHGQRTLLPRHGIEGGDPRIETAFPEGYAMLTKLGKEQMYQAGKWYRQYYFEKISAGYRYDLLTMNSTNQDRALMSAEAFLAGMFPPLENETWADDGLQWQPIPVHTGDEDVIGVQGACDRYDIIEEDKVNHSPEVKKLNAQFMDVFKYIAEHSIHNSTSPTDALRNIHMAWRCYNELDIETAYNFTLPEWAKKVYPQPLQYLSELYFSLKTNTTEMKRLKAGRLLGRIVDDMQKKREGSLPITFHFYSGHETMVAVLLNTLGIFYHIPPEGSSIMFELRLKSEEYIVTVSFLNSTVVPPHLVQLEGCSEFCTLDQFIEIMTPLIPEDYESECQIGFFENLLYSLNIWSIIITVGILIIIGILSVVGRSVIQWRAGKSQYKEVL